MVEHLTVNQRVAGSSPASGAKIIVPAKGWGFYFAVLGTRASNQRFGHPTRAQKLASSTGVDVRCPASGAIRLTSFAHGRRPIRKCVECPERM